MNFVLDLFTKREIMIIGIVVGSLILIVLILTLLDILARKKEENEEINMMFDDLKEEPVLIKKTKEIKKEDIKEEVVSISSEPSVCETEDTKVLCEEKENIVNEIKEVQVDKKIEHIEPIIEDIDDEIKYVEETNQSSALEELLKIEEEVITPKSLEDTLYNLEAMEEENAIISYQELIETTTKIDFIEGTAG